MNKKGEDQDDSEDSQGEDWNINSNRPSSHESFKSENISEEDKEI